MKFFHSPLCIWAPTRGSLFEEDPVFSPMIKSCSSEWAAQWCMGCRDWFSLGRPSYFHNWLMFPLGWLMSGIQNSTKFWVCKILEPTYVSSFGSDRNWEFDKNVHVCESRHSQFDASEGQKVNNLCCCYHSSFFYLAAASFCLKQYLLSATCLGSCGKEWAVILRAE